MSQLFSQLVWYWNLNKREYLIIKLSQYIDAISEVN